VPTRAALIADCSWRGKPDAKAPASLQEAGAIPNREPALPLKL